jgi:hypothetical protein
MCALEPRSDGGRTPKKIEPRSAGLEAVSIRRRSIQKETSTPM